MKHAIKDWIILFEVNYYIHVMLKCYGHVNLPFPSEATRHTILSRFIFYGFWKLRYLRRQRALKEAEEQVRFELRQKEVLKKEEEERRIMAEVKMRRRVLVEMEEKSLREAAESLRVPSIFIE